MLRRRGTLAVPIFSALSAIALSACASAPPPEPVKPKPVVEVVPPEPPPTETPPPPPPPPPEIGSKFVADPQEPLPPGAVARCGTTRMRVTSPAAMAITNTGSIYAIDSVRYGHALRDVVAGRDLVTLANGSGAEFAPDASFFVVPTSYPKGALTFHAVPSGENLGAAAIPLPKTSQKFGKSLFSDSARIDQVIVSPDGKAVVATTSDGAVHLVDAASRKLVKTTKLPKKALLRGVSRGGDRAVFDIAERELGPFAALMGLGLQTVEGYLVLDLRTGATVKRQTFKRPPKDPLDPDMLLPLEHANSTYRLSPDGKTLYRWETGDFTAIDLATGKEQSMLGPSTAGSPAYAGSQGIFGGFGRIGAPRIEIRDDGTAIVGRELLDLASGDLLRLFPGDSVEAVSADGKRWIERSDREILPSEDVAGVRPGHEHPITAIAFFPDNRLATVAGDTYVWHTDDCEARSEGPVSAERVTTAKDKAVALYEGVTPVVVDERGQRRPVKAPPGARSSALAPDGSAALFASGDPYGSEGFLDLVSLEGAEATRSKMKLDGPIQGLAISGDGTLAALSLGEEYSSKPAHLALVSMSEWSQAAKASVRRPGAVAFSGSDLVLFAPEHQGISVRSAANLDEKVVLHDGACCRILAASPDGKLVAGASNRTFVVWDVASRRRVGKRTAHREDIRALAFSPDGRHLATASSDTTILFWDVQKLGTPPLPTKVVTRVTGDAAAKGYFASGGGDLRITAKGTLERVPSDPKNKPPALESVTRLASWYGASCAIAQNKVRCWGSTRDGVLGVPERKGTTKYSVAAVTAPTTLPVPDPVDVQILGGYACALTKAGALHCWGRLSYKDAVAPPTKVLDDVTSFSLGAKVCAAKKDGSVVCWEAGNPTPAAVPMKDVVALAAGGSHLCYLDKAGGAQCSGSNERDQLGDDTGLDRPSPVPVKGLPPAVALTAGLTHTCAITTASNVVCWGLLGDHHLERPTPIPALDGASALQFADHTLCALRADRVDCLDFRVRD